MATLYLLVRNLDTEEASGLIRIENVCDACALKIEKADDLTNDLDVYHNIYQEDILDITSQIFVDGDDYSDLAIVKKEFVQETIGIIKRDDCDDSHEPDTSAFPDRRENNYIEYLSEAQFETYEELAKLPVCVATAIKHLGGNHQLRSGLNLEYFI